MPCFYVGAVEPLTCLSLFFSASLQFAVTKATSSQCASSWSMTYVDVISDIIKDLYLSSLYYHGYIKCILKHMEESRLFLGKMVGTALHQVLSHTFAKYEVDEMSGQTFIVFEHFKKKIIWHPFITLKNQNDFESCSIYYWQKLEILSDLLKFLHLSTAPLFKNWPPFCF